MDEIKVNEEMMETVQIATDMAEIKRTDPERHDAYWKILEQELVNEVRADHTETNPAVAMLKESITHSMIEAIRNDPSVMLELEQFAQENKES